MRVPPALLNDGYNFRTAQAARFGKKSARTAVAVFRRSTEGLRFCRLHAFCPILARFEVSP